MGDKSGTSADVQVSQHDPTAHAQRLFLPKRNPYDHDIITMTSLSY